MFWLFYSRLLTRLAFDLTSLCSVICGYRAPAATISNTAHIDAAAITTRLLRLQSTIAPVSIYSQFPVFHAMLPAPKSRFTAFLTSETELAAFDAIISLHLRHHAWQACAAPSSTRDDQPLGRR